MISTFKLTAIRTEAYSERDGAAPDHGPTSYFHRDFCPIYDETARSYWSIEEGIRDLVVFSSQSGPAEFGGTFSAHSYQPEHSTQAPFAIARRRLPRARWARSLPHWTSLVPSWLARSATLGVTNGLRPCNVDAGLRDG